MIITRSPVLRNGTIRAANYWRTIRSARSISQNNWAAPSALHVLLDSTANIRTMSNNDDLDIESLHHKALQHQDRTYIDPATGFTVLTELAHLRRGRCCGSQCPYGWANVKNASRDAIVESGDLAAIDQRLADLKAMAEEGNNSPTSNDGDATGGIHGGRYTSKNVPYTRGGDKGTSQLLTGERRSKDDEAFQAMGTVDELCSVVGVVHAMLAEQNDVDTEPLPTVLLDVMSRLFDIGSHVAKPVGGKFKANGIGGGFDASHTLELEDWIDRFTDELPDLSSFILPTGAVAAAQLHTARCVCRRAERAVVPLVQLNVCDPNAMAYLNRLSDFLFTAARLVNFRFGKDEILYKRSSLGAKQRDRVVVKFQPEADS